MKILFVFVIITYYLLSPTIIISYSQIKVPIKFHRQEISSSSLQAYNIFGASWKEKRRKSKRKGKLRLSPVGWDYYHLMTNIPGGKEKISTTDSSNVNFRISDNLQSKIYLPHNFDRQWYKSNISTMNFNKNVTRGIIPPQQNVIEGDKDTLSEWQLYKSVLNLRQPSISKF